MDIVGRVPSRGVLRALRARQLTHSALGPGHARILRGFEETPVAQSRQPREQGNQRPAGEIAAGFDGVRRIRPPFQRYLRADRVKVALTVAGMLHSGTTPSRYRSLAMQRHATVNA